PARRGRARRLERSLRCDVLRADRLPRAPRERRHPLARDRDRRRARRPLHGELAPAGRARRHLLVLRERGLGDHLPARLPRAPMTTVARTRSGAAMSWSLLVVALAVPVLALLRDARSGIRRADA